MGGDTSGLPSLFAQPDASVPARHISWTRTLRRVTINHMTPPPPASLERASTVDEPRRRRPAPLVRVLLDWLRFAAMAVVGMLGVWLLVLLFG